MSEYISEKTRELLIKFLNNYKANTKKEYRNVIYLFCNTIKTDFLDVDPSLCKKFLDKQYEKGRLGQLSTNTIITRATVLNSFGKYIADQIPDFDNPFGQIIIPNIDTYIKPKSVPTTEDVNKILEASRDTSSTMYAISSLVAKCGLSVNTICNLKFNDFVVDANFNFGIRINKKDIKLPDDISNILNQFIIEKHGSNRSGYFFLNHWNKRFTPRTLQRNFEKIIIKAFGAEQKGKYTLQELRHFCVSFMLKQNIPYAIDYVGLSPEWMHRYNNVVNSLQLSPIDLNCLSIKPNSFDF